MQARMANPAMSVPGAFAALQALAKAAGKGGLPEAVPELVHLRASQINGCSVCVHMHSRALKKAGESDERIWAVGAWRDAPFYTDAERAALALTESLTRLSDSSDPVPDEVYDEGRQAFRRAGPRLPDPPCRHDQHVEPPERRHEAGGGRVVSLPLRPPGS